MLLRIRSIKLGGVILYEEIDNLMTEQLNENTMNIDSLNTIEIITLMHEEDKKVAYAVEKELPHISLVIDEIVKSLNSGGRLVYIGAGSSGRLGVLDAAECPPTFGTKGEVIGLIAGGIEAMFHAVEGVEDNENEAERQLREIDLSSRDTLVGIAASGRTPYVIGALKYGNSIGAFTAALSCSPDSVISRIARVGITPIVGPEVITGSTRLKAGTAQKMVLNMLTTAAMIKIGKVYQNLMVDVQPTNKKLIERSKNIISRVTGVSREEAEHYFESANKNPKVAIVMIKNKCSREAAISYLKAAGGIISKI